MQEKLFDKYPDVLSVRQLCDVFGIGKDLAYKIIRSGEVKSIKIGRDYKVAKIDVIDYWKSKQGGID